MPFTLHDARLLMHEWVANPSLRVHMEAVAACMHAYGQRVEPTQAERWAICGLLHDFDYEKHPTPDEHPRVGVAHLRSIGIDEEILDAIMGHATYTGTPRVSALSKHLFAVDELAGFIVACGKVRPDGLATLEPSSVVKKLKTPTFAAAVSRQDIDQGILELGTDRDAHIACCIAAIHSSGCVPARQ